MRRHFAGRPARAADLVVRFGLADAEVQAWLRAFHADVSKDRPVAAQLLDVSERIAAMPAARPQRAAMPPVRVADILSAEADRGVFEERLLAGAALALCTWAADGAQAPALDLHSPPRYPRWMA